MVKVSKPVISSNLNYFLPIFLNCDIITTAVKRIKETY